MATRTAAQRRAERRSDHQVAVAACPTQQVLGRLGDKWVALVLKALGEGPRRHGELARTVAGARQKMLTQTLRGLERDGLVVRSVTPAVPVRVDYALTPPVCRNPGPMWRALLTPPVGALALLLSPCLVRGA